MYKASYIDMCVAWWSAESNRAEHIEDFNVNTLGSTHAKKKKPIEITDVKIN